MHQINLPAVWLLMNEHATNVRPSLWPGRAWLALSVWGLFLTKLTMVCARSHCLPTNYAWAGKQAHGAK